MERHVGQTLEDLSARLETTRLPAASSFDTIDEAAAAVSTTLQRNSQVIDEWLANGAVRYLELDAPFNGGAVLERGSAQAVAGTGARVVLKGDGNGGWLVLTGFPTP
ncbi:RNase A-like domain-containing protein [Mycobacterium sp. ITM-2016-00316]|uniref:RNase A-like domain-containing protein n=1 Tax=Mycobacterium sp. ITM-2016-00316 TaxID=2099695 RepID=UPI001E4C7337|nr:RNase A-like domain-containing protein [Mycobacterium sp. ITM-2016-00316]WNG80599.1 RNase A-like domain-containing protein [Mycobacterium sp. ITM-2016-00316]